VKEEGYITMTISKKRTSSGEGTPPLIPITAPMEEWEALGQLVTSYRRQSRALHRYTPMLALLNDFQRRFTQATGRKSPDDYMI
jgi:hypothetical protein